MNKELIFFDIEKHLIKDEKPSIYIKQILESGNLDCYPFSMIKDLKKINQNPKFHPEGDVFEHTMMVIDEGAKYRYKSNDKRAFMWTLLLHDIGKVPTTKMRNGKLTSYDHDKVGKTMAIDFLKYFNEDYEFIKKVSSLIRWHMQSLFVSKGMKFKNLEGMLKDVDKNEIILISLADRLGRGFFNENDRENTKEDIRKFQIEIDKSLNIWRCILFTNINYIEYNRIR